MKKDEKMQENNPKVLNYLGSTISDEINSEEKTEIYPAQNTDETIHESTLLLLNSENEPTKTFPVNESDENAIPDLKNTNVLKPSFLRSLFILSLFFLSLSATFISIYYQQRIAPIYDIEETLSEFTVIADEIKEIHPDGVIVKKYPIEPLFVEGDKIISLNGILFEQRQDFLYAYNFLKPNEVFTVRVKRGNELIDLELKTEPSDKTIRHYLFSVLPFSIFFLVGLIVFLLKPNDKPALLLAVSLALCGAFIFTHPNLSGQSALINFNWEFPRIVRILRGATFLAGLFCLVTFLHLFLIFPQKLELIRRFPKIEWLIYLPFLFLSLFPLVFERFLPESLTNSLFMALVVFGTATLYFLSIPAALIFGYWNTNQTDKRRLRLILASILFAVIPFVVKIPLDTLWLLKLTDPNNSTFQTIYPSWLLQSIPLVLIPIAFAYAILKHRVIPISLVIRRGLQYLLAKNALRLLLFLPILGIIWNIADNPSRPLDQILLNNSVGFYLCILSAIGLFLLSRYGLNDWIDKRFFRQQYDQEKLLRELSEAVKDSDSLPKLSRLVSSQLQSALHPNSIYIFFQEENTNSYGLGYTTQENDLNLNLVADSPLLRFIENNQTAFEFPSRHTNDLPNQEKKWLEEIEANLLVPMHGTDGKLVGVFALGEKKSEIPYTKRDKELLGTLANQMALVYENLTLKDRVRREQQIKTEVLSRLDEDNINLLKQCLVCGKCYDHKTKRCEADNTKLQLTLPVERVIEGRYRLEKFIGKGGMGSVFEATDLRIGRQVAIKILSGAMFGNKDALRRFEREAKTAGRLQHPNIVTIFDYGVLSTEGAFLVMELVKGETLRDVLNRQGKLNIKTVSDWFSQILEGVEAAHKAGIIHRDLKPENVLVTKAQNNQHRLCILDFGLAKLSETNFKESVTMPGMILGTLGYMAFEQLRGQRANERSDLFATGVMIYEALYGERPFQGESYQKLMQAMSNAPSVSDNFAEFFKNALAQETIERFGSASEMKHSLLNSAI